MRAIHFEAPQTVRLIDDAPPPQMGDGEAMIRCTHVGLCGSNRGPYLGEGRWASVDWPPPPGWMGHENVGVVVDTRCDGWPVGSRVLAQGKDPNGFAEYIVATPQSIARLPDAGEDTGAFVIAQPLATVMRALASTEPPIGERCAVIGQGPIGLMFTHLMRRMGAAQVIAVDRVPWRLEWSLRLGATDVVDAGRADVVEAVRELTGGHMVDFCVEAGSTPEALLTAAHLPRRQGRLCVFGVPDDDLQPFPWFHTTNNETRFVIRRGAGSRAYYQRAVDWLATDLAPLQDLVRPRMRWEQAAEAFHMYAHPADYRDSLKIILSLDGR